MYIYRYDGTGQYLFLDHGITVWSTKQSLSKIREYIEHVFTKKVYVLIVESEPGIFTLVTEE